MIRPLNTNQKQFVKWIAGAAIRKGQIVILDTTAQPTAEGISTTILLGVAAEDCESGATAILYHPDQDFVGDFYQGGATDVATAALLGTKYDIYVDGAAGDSGAEGEMYIDLNDTTNPFLFLIDYNNATRTGTFRFLRSLLLI